MLYESPDRINLRVKSETARVQFKSLVLFMSQSISHTCAPNNVFGLISVSA